MTDSSENEFTLKLNHPRPEQGFVQLYVRREAPERFLFEALDEAGRRSARWSATVQRGAVVVAASTPDDPTFAAQARAGGGTVEITFAGQRLRVLDDTAAPSGRLESISALVRAAGFTVPRGVDLDALWPVEPTTPPPELMGIIGDIWSWLWKRFWIFRAAWVIGKALVECEQTWSDYGPGTYDEAMLRCMTAKLMPW